ncbi:MAG: ABC transporter substrate-binding protein [Roseiflexaceae bacterium]
MRRFMMWLVWLGFSVTISACASLPKYDDLWQQPAGFPTGGRITIAVPERIDVVQPWHIHNRAVELFLSLSHAGLMRLDTTGMPQPELIADWQASRDQTVVTATLKADLRWSDDTPLTATDVVFTYNMIKSLPATTPLLAEFAVIDAVERVDDTHVRFLLLRPYAPLLSMWALPILPAHVLAAQQVADVNMRNLTVSAGPFTYHARSEDGTIELIRNPHYVHGAALLDAVVLRTGQSDQQMQTDVGLGVVDIAEFATTPSLTTAIPVSSTTYAQHQMIVAIYNMRMGRITRDGAVRSALSAQAIGAMDALFLPQSWVTQAITPTIQRPSASQILDDAGWRLDAAGTLRQRGDDALTLTMLVASDNAMLMTQATLLEQQWQALGIRIDRQNLVRDAYLNALIPPYPFDVILVALAGGRSSSTYADTLFYEPDVRALFDASQRNDGIPNTRGSLNFSGIQDTTINAVLARIQETYETDSRQHLYVDLVDALQQQIPLQVVHRNMTTVWYGARLHATTGSLQFNSPWYPANASRWYVQPPPQ